jgi:YrbI family 3-deoxy-D-manno-octulosonate 8-phosphate phosphatase
MQYTAAKLKQSRIQGRRKPDVSMLPKKVGAVIFDFDGVFTDNRVFVNQDGIESVAANRSDGLGLDHLRDAGLPLLVLSKEKNPVVAARAKKLRLPVLQGIDDKGPALLKWLSERGIDPADAIYLGNDTNDLPCLQLVGCGVAVADAHPSILPAARIVLTRRGGHGAIRELADLIMKKRNQ